CLGPGRDDRRVAVGAVAVGVAHVEAAGLAGALADRARLADVREGLVHAAVAVVVRRVALLDPRPDVVVAGARRGRAGLDTDLAGADAGPGPEVAAAREPVAGHGQLVDDVVAVLVAATADLRHRLDAADAHELAALTVELAEGAVTDVGAAVRVAVREDVGFL